MATQNEWKDMTPNELWRIYLNEGVPGLKRRAPPLLRMVMSLETGFLKVLPSDPRCMWCYAPFRGVGSPFMKAIGKGQSNLNPNLCMDCEHVIHKNSGGAEVELSILFADIRGSTQLAEEISPSAFSQIINRFFTVATNELIMFDALIDKLIGDEVTAFFVPGLAGKDHVIRAVEAGKKLLVATGHADPDGPWVPVGIGIHTGVAYVGIVGDEKGVMDITVLGDVANTGSRLASKAGPGEIIVSEDVAQKAGLITTELESRALTLKGKSEPLQSWVIKAIPKSKNRFQESS